MDTFIDNYDDWVDLAKSFVGDTYAQDIVQEAYIKLSGYESKDFNRGYIYLTIRSLCLDFIKAKNKIVKEEIEDYNAEYVDETETKQAYNALLAKIDAEIETWHWYDRELFKLYKDTPMSLRTLANETGISITSIHITIKRCKDILNEKFSEDYIDFLNEDYELL